MTPRNVDCPTLGRLTTAIPVNSRNLSVLPFKGNTRHVLRGGRISYSVRKLGFGVRGGTRITHTTRRKVIFSFGCNVSVVGRVKVSVKIVHTNGTGLFLDPVFQSTLTNIAKAIVRLCSAGKTIKTTGNTNVKTNVCTSTRRTFTSLGGVGIVRPSKLGTSGCYKTFRI